MICPHCNRTIAEQDRYLMSADPDAPNLLGTLAGEAGRFLQGLSYLGSLLVVFVVALGFAALVAKVA